VIEEEVYIEQPYGFVIHGKESHVCMLKKAPYGLKQAPRAWYARIDGYLMSLGFNKNVVDANLYYKVVDGESLFLILYIDDLFLTEAEHLIALCKHELASKFDMKDLGMMHYFLELEVWQRTDEIFLSRGKYIVEILRRFGILDCKSMTTPMVMNLKKLSEPSSYSDLIDPTIYRQLIGSLTYLVNTRQDICYALSALSKFTSQPRQIHWVAAKHVLRYLRGTVGYGLRHASSVDMRLQGYVESDWAGSIVDRKSTSGCCFNFGVVVVYWCSKKQTLVALSTTKTKYIAICMAVCEAVWLRNLLPGLSNQILDPTVIHYIRDMVQRKIVLVEYLPTDEQIVDVLTEPLAKSKFEYFCDKLGEECPSR
jgi:hypothetical protein